MVRSTSSILSERKDLSHNWAPATRIAMGKRINQLHHEHDVSFPLIARRFGVSYTLVKQMYREFLAAEKKTIDSSKVTKNKTIKEY